MARQELVLKPDPAWSGALAPVPGALGNGLGNFDAYVSAVNRIPLLTPEEEAQFARSFREHGDLEAAGKLVLSHLRLVVSVARNYLGYGLPHADLVQEGNIGLMKAVKRFDPDRGVRLVSFALHWIKAEIHEYVLRNWRMVKLATTKSQRKLFFNLRSMKKGSATMTGDEIDGVAHELNVRPEDVREMETRMGGGDVAIEGRPDEEGESFGPASWLTDPESEPTRVLERQATDWLQGDGVRQALDALDARSRRIIEARWLEENEDGSVGTVTLHELAKEFGVSAERIRQIEAKALRTMRGELQQYA
jgi:RNA polymerase sigma-32 factor